MSPKERLRYPSVRIPAAISIAGDFLEFEYSSADEWRRPTDGTVIEFSKLDTNEKILQFARRSGVLNVVEIKREHQESTDFELSSGSIWSPSRFGGKGKEPLALWLLLARRMRAILRINSSLKGRTRNPLPLVGQESDWTVLGASVPLEDPKDAQFFLLLEINDWLRRGGEGLELGISEWSRLKTDWKLELSYNGLLGGLAYRLLLMVVGESNLFACDGCGTPYIRLKRAPRPGQENFCDDCTDVAGKRAVQRYREGKRVKS